MSYQYPSATENNNGLFGPTNNNHYYTSVHYHKRNATHKKGKTRWAIPSNGEYHVFKTADENQWLCNNNNALFSVIDMGNEVLGENEERLGYFRVPVNTSDPWHGFPVMSSNYAPSSDLLDFWEKKGIIPYHFRLKIELRKV